MDADFAEAVRLMQEALAGPPGVTQVTTRSGQVMQIERDPEPGVRVRLVTEGTEEKPGAWDMLNVAAVDERPGLYPSSVPFVPGVEAIVAMFAGMITVMWQPPGSAVCAVPDLQPDAELEELGKRLKAIGEAVRGGDRTEQGSAREKVKAMIDSLEPEARSKLEEVWQALQPEAEVLGRLERIFETVAKASVEDGWLVLERKEKDSPFRSLSVKLERDEFSRSILMMGVSRNVVLIQRSRDSETAA